MLQLQAILERCGARFDSICEETRLCELGLDSLGYVQLWTEIASEDFPINALFDADIHDWNLRDVLYFSNLAQKGSKQKIFQRRLQKSELPFVIAKCLECGSESGSAVLALAKSLKVAYKHCLCEGFYMRDSRCLGFFIAFVQPKHIYIPIVWIDSKHQSKAISLLIWRNLAPLLPKRTLTAPLWAKQHFARYVVSEKDGIVTLDSEAIAQRFRNGTLQENQE